MMQKLARNAKKYTAKSTVKFEDILQAPTPTIPPKVPPKVPLIIK